AVPAIAAFHIALNSALNMGHLRMALLDAGSRRPRRSRRKLKFGHDALVILSISQLGSAAPTAVMPGHPGPAFGRPECKLVPGIHAFLRCRQARKTWMAGTIGERSDA